MSKTNDKKTENTVSELKKFIKQFETEEKDLKQNLKSLLTEANKLATGIQKEDSDSSELLEKKYSEKNKIFDYFLKEIEEKNDANKYLEYLNYHKYSKLEEKIKQIDIESCKSLIDKIKQDDSKGYNLILISIDKKDVDIEEIKAIIKSKNLSLTPILIKHLGNFTLYGSFKGGPWKPTPGLNCSRLGLHFSSTTYYLLLSHQVPVGLYEEIASKQAHTGPKPSDNEKKEAEKLLKDRIDVDRKKARRALDDSSEANLHKENKKEIKEAMNFLSRLFQLKDEPVESSIELVRKNLDSLYNLNFVAYKREDDPLKKYLNTIDQYVNSPSIVLNELLVYQILIAYKAYITANSSGLTHYILHSSPEHARALLLTLSASTGFAKNIRTIGEFLKNNTTMRDESFITYMLKILLGGSGWITLLSKDYYYNDTDEDERKQPMYKNIIHALKDYRSQTGLRRALECVKQEVHLPLNCDNNPISTKEIAPLEKQERLFFRQSTDERTKLREEAAKILLTASSTSPAVK